MENDLLRKAQLKMLTALIELDSICSKHNINYWIDAGTLLGAVRHKGFIPWDDDIDVCMIRKDFNKFIKVCSYELNKNNFFLQTINTDSHYKTYNIPCKLRVNNTLIIEESELKLGYYNDKSHHGLFLDVFPYDKYSKNKYKMKFIERALSLIYKIKTYSTFKKIPLHKKIIYRTMSIFIPIHFLELIKKHITKKINNKSNNYFYSAGIETPFSRAQFEEQEIFPLQRLEFEGYSFLAPNNHNRYLEKMFGKNYMTPPKEKDKISHYHKISV
ncbi:phosphorylcholine transferase LicD [Proteus vulgaris]|uniref:phosphorylcholine transferase LicD n=1 Tax=Proteus vulgaris TaxID=585 RepID=UPI0034D3EBD7